MSDHSTATQTHSAVERLNPTVDNSRAALLKGVLNVGQLVAVEDRPDSEALTELFFFGCGAAWETEDGHWDLYLPVLLPITPVDGNYSEALNTSEGVIAHTGVKRRRPENDDSTVR